MCGTFWVVWGSECAACGFVVGVGQFGGLGVVRVQRVALWWMLDNLVVWGIECVSGCFVVGVGQYGGLSVQRVALPCV